jgi:uncharacterized protein DUF4286
MDNAPAAGEPRTSMLMVVIEIDPEHEAELNQWYDEEHIPEKLAAPGFRSARRFKDHLTPGRYLTLYEIDDPDEPNSPQYMSQPSTDWTKSIMAKVRSLDRNVWVEITKR